MCLKVEFFRNITIVCCLISLPIIRSNETLLLPEDSDLNIATHAIYNIAEEFLLKQKIDFHVLLVSKFVSSDLHNIVNDFLLKLNGRLSYFLYYSEISKRFFLLYKSFFLFYESFADYENSQDDTAIIRKNNLPIIYFIFIHNLTYYELKSSKIFENFKNLMFFSDKVFIHSFFVINEKETVRLVSIEWYSEHICNEAHLKTLNIFHKDTMRWESKLEYYEKFMNYYECELVMMLPVPHENGILYHVSGYAVLNTLKKSYKMHGITPKVFQIASKIHNFTEGYQFVKAEKDFISKFSKKNVNPVIFNNSIKIPQVHFEMLRAHIKTSFLQMTNYFVSQRTYIVVTPDKPYTSFEKFLLTFDKSTWILLIVVVFATFFTILILNRSSLRAQDFVDRHRINNPFFRTISILFGIPQAHFPVQNFTRIILAIFIWFCLMFRICFQNKMFEFMTSKPRRPLPRKYEDLIDRNYITYTPYVSSLHEHIVDQYGRR